MEKWNPIPQDLVAGLNKAAWTKHCQAPELVGYAWAFQQLNLGDIVSVRDLATYAGWGKTKAQRILARARDDWEAWNEKEAPKHESCRPRKGSGQPRDTAGTAAGHRRDSRGTPSGQVEPDGADIVEPQRDSGGTAAGQQRDTAGTAAGQSRDDRAPDPTGTPTRTPDTSPPTPPAGGACSEEVDDPGADSGDDPRGAALGPQPTGPAAGASPGPGTAAVPSWLPRRLPERLDGAVLGQTVLDCIEAITGTRPELEQTEGQHKPVLQLWHQARQRTGDLHGLLRDVALVATWARWAGVPGAATMRRDGDHAKPAAVCDYRKWAGRLRSARDWADRYGWAWDGRVWRQVGDQPERDAGPQEATQSPAAALGVSEAWWRQVFDRSTRVLEQGQEYSAIVKVGQVLGAESRIQLSGQDLAADVEAVTAECRALVAA